MQVGCIYIGIQECFIYIYIYTYNIHTQRYIYIVAAPSVYIWGVFGWNLFGGWHPGPLQPHRLSTDTEQNCQHVIFFNLSLLGSNNISQHPPAIAVVRFCLTLIFVPFPWCLFPCISPEWSHYRFSLSHAVHQSEYLDFVWKGHCETKVV